MPAPLHLIDTHSHFDAPDFDADRPKLLQEARAVGVTDGLLCAGSVTGFEATRSTAYSIGWHYALGIHPLFLPPDNAAVTADVHQLRIALTRIRDDMRLAAVGEIGLDGFVKTLNWERQVFLFSEQLKVARDFELPVSVHARHAVDAVYSHLKRLNVTRGVIHAFNGSEVQAERFLKLGFKLGFGGALLYSGSLRIRRIFASVGPEDYVLETDAPDMPAPFRREAADTRTHPADIRRYAEEAARLRNTTPEVIAKESCLNALAAFPRLASENSSNRSGK